MSDDSRSGQTRLGTGAGEYPLGQEPVSSDRKFEALVAEADGFYKTIIAVSTAVMGGTLIFLDRVAKHPTKASIVVLGIGWVFLFAAIGAILYVRRQNLESLRQALRAEYPEARTIDSRTRRASSWAPILMILGMALVGFSGLMNVWQRAGGGDEMKETTDVMRAPLSIAGGDTGPRAPAPTPHMPPEKVQSPSTDTSQTKDSGKAPR